MKIHSLDSYTRRRTKRIRGVDLTADGVTAEASRILFRPPYGTKFVLRGVITYNRSVEGTVSDAPNILIDNGTDTENLVAGNDLATGEGVVKTHTLAALAGTQIIDHDHPLRLKSVDAADGATAFLVDVYLELLELTGF